MIPDFNTLKEEALLRLQNNWTNPVLAILVAGIINGVAGIIPFGNILTSGAFTLGLAIFFLKVSRQQTVEVGNIFDGFKEYGKSIIAFLLIIIIVFFGLIFLIVPGIIAALALSQTYRIIHDNPTMSVTDAMQKSHEMMKGHRGEYFLLNLSFIGWAFLCLLTLGIGFLWLGAYVSTTNSIFYNYLSDYKNSEIETIATELID